jgi:GNAT superfamily N-acetyltransferase
LSEQQPGVAGDDVRLATDDDWRAIARLRREWVEENAGEPLDDPDYLPAFEAWFEVERRQRLTWLGLADGRADGHPVGMLNMLVFQRMPKPSARAQDLPMEWGYVANVFVDAAHRRSGLGARMLAACTTYADAHRFARIVLTPSERSVPFYARAGFEPATRLMVRPGR